MILALDISSSKIGIAILDDQENILYVNCLKFKPKQSLEDRAIELQYYLLDLNIERNYLPEIIDKIYIEEPFTAMFGGQSTAKTTATLNCFNGMCRVIVRQIFKKDPIMINPRSARSKLGIKIPKGSNSKEKKRVIIDFVCRKYKDTQTPFNYELTKHNNPVPGTDDKADSIVLALAGPKIKI